MNEMPTTIETQLRELTAWSGPTPGLWKKALAATRHTPDPASRWRRLAPWWTLPAVAAAAILIAVGIGLHNYAGWPESSPAAPTADGSCEASVARVAVSGQEIAHSGPKHFYAGIGIAGAPAAGGRGFGGFTPDETGDGGEGELADFAGQRQVVRNATIELGAADVRSAYLKARHLVSEAQGEYVQESSLTGYEEQLTANLVLRVRAARVDALLDALRQLGRVRSERTSAEDVTAQVVDVEARLQNERRVEAELLELLENRENSPLKDVLELREALRRVREQIERLDAQRERLARLVALATVVVVIQSENAPEPDSGPGAAALRLFKWAWRDGVHFLVETLAFLLSVLVGGLIWWVLLVGLVLWYRGHRRRHAAAAATATAGSSIG